MTNQLNKNYSQRKNLLLMMLFFSFICLFFGTVRIQITGNYKGLFLVWNLFLAWVPFLVAFSLCQKKKKIHKAKLVAYLALWLLFLPNAPYIITDFVHLRPRAGVPFWYDGMAIFIFAFHGLILGIVSTLFIHEALEKYTNKSGAWIFLSFSFILTGYGIYLGRFLRWNSWDILVNPIALLQDSLLKITNPLAIAVTGIFSLIMFFSYLIFYQLIHLKDNSYDSKNA
jgi:uncharacterized membrane protein